MAADAFDTTPGLGFHVLGFTEAGVMDQQRMPRSYNRFRAFTRHDLDQIPQLQRLPRERLELMKAISEVFPFRVNQYVLDELIDWNNIPEDPVFQFTFPQEGMLTGKSLEQMLALVRSGASAAARQAAAHEIQRRHNPHPGGQMDKNVPMVGDTQLSGLQHKYHETVLFFPSNGQTCHAYCTYCFRWAQFVGRKELKMASSDTEALLRYIAVRPEVTDVLMTGGDSMIMHTQALRRHVEPLLRCEQIRSIRFGTKALAFWPHRFVDDEDADDLLRLFEEIVAAGKHVALMAHYSHPRELSTPLAVQAVRRVRATGAVIRCQAPIIKHVNDSAAVWSELWQAQVEQGMVPYYMFVARDTGPKEYFAVPLARAFDIYVEAVSRLSGIGRTARGPVMSLTPGKLVLDGTAEVAGEQVFVFRFLQARNRAWLHKPFFARYDAEATWLDYLKPAFGESEFFFARELHRVAKAG